MLAAQHEHMNPLWRLALTNINDAFTYVFITEAALKLVAYGPGSYFADRWNSFDCLVALLSLAGTVLGYFDLSGITILNVLRILRIFRLIPRHAGLLRLFNTLVRALSLHDPRPSQVCALPPLKPALLTPPRPHFLVPRRGSPSPRS